MKMSKLDTVLLVVALATIFILLAVILKGSYWNHDPISIDGNGALATFIDDEGLSGDGTFASPYIIENFTIYADGHGIEIRSTDAYLIIRGCTIEGTKKFGMSGIVLRNVANVDISKNLLYNNDLGIYLSSSNNNTLSGNKANDNYWNGIRLDDSSSNTLSGNSVKNNGNGISLFGSSNNILSGNEANSNYIGILLDHSNNNTLSGNSANYNNENGINLRDSSNSSTIYFNYLYGNKKNQAFEDTDCTDNQWDNGTTGNYWGEDYISNYPSATNDGKIWDIPCEISGNGSGIDHFPLVNAVISSETTTTDDLGSTTPGFSLLAAISTGIFLFIRSRKRRKNR